jgi:ABC-2 type transport system ATP-binding protein
MTGRENLRYTARLNGLYGADAEGRIGAALEQVGMERRADARVDTYSRGMLQRLGIADALVKDPSVLILDEPTTAIDPIGVVEILELLRGLVRERDLAVLLSSHLLAQVQSVCDRIGIFAAGKLIGVGTVAELARQFGGAGAHIEVGFEGLDAAGRRKTAEVLAKVDGISEVRLPAGERDPFVLVVTDEDSGPAREAVLAVAASNGLRLSSIRDVQPSLDDIYRAAVRSSGITEHGEVAA